MGASEMTVAVSPAALQRHNGQRLQPCFFCAGFVLVRQNE